MSTLALSPDRVDAAATPAPAPRPTAASVPAMDNRPVYVSFGLAWLVGHGAAALAAGDSPLLRLPALVPTGLLIVGMVAAMTITTVVSIRANRGLPPAQVRTNNLLAGGWAVGFGALFLLITALGRVTGDDHLAAVLWPTGSGLVVGLLYLGYGAVNRDTLQYALGSWLAVVSTAAVFLAPPALFAVLALAGGGAYLAAAALEHRRRPR